MRALGPTRCLAQGRQDSTGILSAHSRRASVPRIPGRAWRLLRKPALPEFASVSSNAPEVTRCGSSHLPFQGPICSGSSSSVSRRSGAQGRRLRRLAGCTCPFGPTVRQLFVVRLSFPSTMPSTKRSSLPVTSPLIRIPWLIHAAARDEGARELEGVLAVAGLDEVAEFTGIAELPVTPSGFASSFFHISHLDIENWIFEAAYRRAGWSCDSEE